MQLSLLQPDTHPVVPLMQKVPGLPPGPFTPYLETLAELLVI